MCWKYELHLNIDKNELNHQMSLSKSTYWYSNNYLHFWKRSIPIENNQILPNKISHRYLVTTELFSVWKSLIDTSLNLLWMGFDQIVSTSFGQKPLGRQTMEQATFKNVTNYINTKIYSYLETSDGQSSNLYLVHFFNTWVN